MSETQVATSGSSTLLTGEGYRESLRDGRTVFYKGKRIEDVTTHPLTRQGIDFTSRLYDLQFEDETRDILTYEDANGDRWMTAWMLPQSQEDLDRKRRDGEFRAWESFGSLNARNPDFIPWTAMNYLAFHNRHKEWSPEYADNMLAGVEDFRKRSVHLASASTQLQGTRSRSGKAAGDGKAAGERTGVMRVVSEDSGGVYVSGARTVGTVAAQANEMLLFALTTPETLREEEGIVFTVPVATKGLSLVCREAVVAAAADDPTRPMARVGEEVDTVVMLDEVYIPNERIWSRSRNSCDGALYSVGSGGEAWALLMRMAVRADFFMALGQLLVDTLGTSKNVIVRDTVGQLIEYGRIIRGGVEAAQAAARRTESDLLLMPDALTCHAFRTYALERYPYISQKLQELAGQGMVIRFSEEDFDSPEYGAKLEEYLAYDHVSARDKNLLMNVLWDQTASAVAGRVSAFENLNGLPAFAHRATLYNNFDRSEQIARVRSLIGFGT
ncbi:4-hydroxyphenylacetate 3-hydroxylase N-terminal domain-containing protein [Dietzia lutea]|uniref:4-hydroxyphenylacetate 3-hydroxylase n=1 Tax=Dietzia lutea TaxID=546160 RepID=A0A2S1RD11_9ACTN|nr:4-hydroxyphenylacetate 3-hydroxylase N-terminal domain-containing protein [Dietzia lutea]AWH94121.1 hypothetical protein A6035_17385 [Dietzia lutea]